MTGQATAHSQKANRGQQVLALTGVALTYALISLAVTYPVGVNLARGLVQHREWAYDGFHYTYLIWWARQALLKLHISPADLRWVNYPFGLYHPLATTYALFYLLGTAFAPFLSPVETFNVLTLLAFFLSGICAYALCAYLTGDRWAGLLGGIVYAFFPCHTAHALGGHLDLISIYPFPLYFLLLIKCVRRPQATTALLCALALTASLLVHPLFIPYLLAPVTLIGLFYEWITLRTPMHSRTATLLLGACGLAVLLILPFYLPLLRVQFQSEGNYLQQSGAQVFSADLLGIVAPPPSNPLLGALGLIPDYSRHTIPSGWLSSELTVYAGFVPLILAAVGAWCRRRECGTWILVALAAFLLSLGPFLKVGGRLVVCEIGNVKTPIPLPYILLARLPLFSLGRTPVRFNFTFMLSLAVLSAHGMSILLHRFPRRWGPVLAAGLILLIVGEYLVEWPYPMKPLRVSDSLSELASSPGNEAVLNLPWPSQHAKLIGLFYQTIHQRPVFDSWVQRPPPAFPDVADFLGELLSPSPEQDIVPLPETGARGAVAHALGAGYVLLLSSYAESPQAYSQLLSSEFANPISTGGDVAVYRVPSYTQNLDGLVYALPGEQWSRVEQWNGRPARWMSERAGLYLYSSTAQVGQIRFTAVPFSATQPLEILVNGTPFLSLTVSDQLTYTTTSFTLDPGLNGIMFQTPDGCYPFIGDPRCTGPARLAGAECDPYLRFERCLSILFQDIRFVPVSYPGGDVIENGTLVTLSENEN